jgi:hypothetical protein
MTNHITYLNNGPMVKDLFLKHGNEGVGVQIITLTLVGLGGLVAWLGCLGAYPRFLN